MKENNPVDLENSIKEPLEELIGVQIKNLEIEFQEKGSSMSVFKATITTTESKPLELIIKRRKDDNDYVIYKEYLEPYDLNYPHIYGFINVNNSQYAVIDYISHKQPDWGDESRYFKALDWLIKKDQTSSESIEALTKKTFLKGLNWYGTNDWLPELKQAAESKVEESVQKVYPLVLKNKSLIDSFINDLESQGTLTIVHGDFNMNNILYGKDEHEDKVFVIDWTQPHIGSVCKDLVGLIDAAPDPIKDELLKSYKAKINFSNFDELYEKAQIVYDLGYYSWMILMFNDDTSQYVSQKDLERLSKRLIKNLP